MDSKNNHANHAVKEQRKLPYIEKIITVSDIDVWIVDGMYIRTNIDREFTNFGQYYRFKFIPKNEFWIDKEKIGGEEDFYIEHLLVENRLMEEGMPYEQAIDKANRAEKKLRKEVLLAKEEIRPDMTKAEYIEKAHKKLLTKYSNGIKVWIVDGALVRTVFFMDFTEGGHDQVYKFVPKGEVWLDDDLSEKEIKLILLHELHERCLMSQGWDYDTAHRKASSIEYHCRHHPEDLEKKLDEEIEKNKKENLVLLNCPMAKPSAAITVPVSFKPSAKP